MLTAMLEEHAPGHDVWCLTDQPDTPGNTIPLRHGLSGWWSKMELFAPENRALRPFLFLDLDTYVLGPIGDILNWRPDRLAMLADFYWPERLASGVMVVPDYQDDVWQQFDRANDIGHSGGDQEIIARAVPDAIRLQHRFTGIASYKVDGPDSGRIVCFHGQPKPHTADEKHPWVRDVWSRYG